MSLSSTVRGRSQQARRRGGAAQMARMAQMALVLALGAVMAACQSPASRMQAGGPGAGGGAGADASSLSPPVARQIPKDVTVHGDTRIDPYYWLRERDNPAVMAHLQAEAAYTDRWFQRLQPLQDTLYQEMVARMAPFDEDVPVRRGAWWYAKRTIAGAQYPQYIRRAAQGPQRLDDAQAPAQVLLDLNELAKGRQFLSVSQVEPSPDGRRLLYSLDDSGYRDFQLRIRDLASGQDLPWVGERTDGAVWSADGRTVFYIRSDEARRRSQLWRHAVDGAAPDVLVFEEKDPLFNLELHATADGRWLQLVSYAKNATEVMLLPADRPDAAWRPVLARRAGQEYRVEHRNGQLYLLINDRGPDFRLVRVAMPQGAAARRGKAASPSVGAPLLQAGDLARARELLPYSETVSPERLRPFARHLVLQWRENGAVKLGVLDESGLGLGRRRPGPATVTPFAMPDPMSSAQLDEQHELNGEFDSDEVRLKYQTLLTPPTVMDYRFSDRRLQVRKQQPVLGYDPSRYASERVWATAADGTRVPVALIYAKALRGEGPRPLLLRGYGSYGLSIDHRFNAQDVSLLDRGVVLATAYVRGGGEMGRRWYLDGKLDKKMNSFTDFIASAEMLVRSGWTRPEQLIITGRSAGGLLVGAATDLRPDLFKAVVAEVPFVDVINTMLDETIPLTTEEFEEWGNPKRPADYAWMRAYSPYDNLKPGAYPAVLARAGLNDSQVPYWEPAKFVARLRSVKTDTRPVLFDINLTAGHGGASGRYDALRERARVYAFMLDQWGLAGR
ncbi:S9 family peptidase [Roseateles depolymerans]|nr:S9 family peptidase [Roseateles depolymerans]